MLWAAVTRCFLGVFRSGEITVPADSAFDEGARLTCKDVSVDSLENPQVLRIRLKASKTGWGSMCLWAGQTSPCAQSQQCWPIWRLEGLAWVRSFSLKMVGSSRVQGWWPRSRKPSQQLEWTAHRFLGTASGAEQRLQLPGRGGEKPRSRC